MIISGYNISGYSVLGAEKLSSIGKLMYWYDYRFGADIKTYGGIQRVFSLADLSQNSLDIASSGVSNDTTRPKVLADGFGMNNVSPSYVSMGGVYKDEVVGVVHKGGPILQLFVGRLDNTVGTLTATFSTHAPGKPGAQLRFIPGTRSLNFILQNDVGTNVRNYGTPTNSVPLSETCVFAHWYYGAGTGTNNSKLSIKNTIYTFTSNPTHGVNAAPYYYIFTSVGNAEFQIKLSIGYDLVGKTPAEIEVFVAKVFSLLKTDTEYSTLLTP